MSSSLGNRITLSSRPGTTKLSLLSTAGAGVWDVRNQGGRCGHSSVQPAPSKAPVPWRTMAKDHDRMFQTDSESQHISLWASTECSQKPPASKVSIHKGEEGPQGEEGQAPDLIDRKGGGSGVTEPGIPNWEIKSRERSQSQTRGLSWEAAWNTGEWVRLLVSGQQRAHAGLGRYWGSGERGGNSNYKRMHSHKGCHAGSCLWASAHAVPDHPDCHSRSQHLTSPSSHDTSAQEFFLCGVSPSLSPLRHLLSYKQSLPCNKHNIWYTAGA